jgi:methylenetetrahydrofolate reductase (NADPH)
MNKAAAIHSEIFPIAGMLDGYSIELNPSDSKSIDAATTRLAPGTEVYLTWIGGEEPMNAIAPAAQLRRAGLCPVLHISSRYIKSEEQLKQFVSALVEVDVERVLVIGGDNAKPAGPFDSSMTVLQSGILQKAGITHVSVGGFPEGNPHVPHLDLLELLALKLQFGRSSGLQMSIATQFAFEAAPVADWLKRIRSAGIDVPVRLGVAGPAGILTLTRYALRCGVGKSLHVLAENPAFAKLLVEKGPEPLLHNLAVELGADGKLPAGVAGMHFFVFGGFNKTVDWIHACRLAAGRVFSPRCETA